MDFKPGDTVQLKSGGPIMTVYEIDTQGAYCEWFDDKKTHQRHVFALIVLKRYEEASIL